MRLTTRLTPRPRAKGKGKGKASSQRRDHDRASNSEQGNMSFDCSSTDEEDVSSKDSMLSQYSLVFAGLTKRELLDGKKLIGDAHFKTPILRHAIEKYIFYAYYVCSLLIVDSTYCAKSLPTLGQLLELAAILRVPLHHGPEVAEVCFNKILTWIEGNVNAKSTRGLILEESTGTSYKIKVAKVLRDAVVKPNFSSDLVLSPKDAKLHEKHLQNGAQFFDLVDRNTASKKTLVKAVLSHLVVSGMITNDGGRKSASTAQSTPIQYPSAASQSYYSQPAPRRTPARYIPAPAPASVPATFGDKPLDFSLSDSGNDTDPILFSSDDEPGFGKGLPIPYAAHLVEPEETPTRKSKRTSRNLNTNAIWLPETDDSSLTAGSLSASKFASKAKASSSRKGKEKEQDNTTADGSKKRAQKPHSHLLQRLQCRVSIHHDWSAYRDLNELVDIFHFNTLKTLVELYDPEVIQRMADGKKVKTEAEAEAELSDQMLKDGRGFNDESEDDDHGHNHDPSSSSCLPGRSSLLAVLDRLDLESSKDGEKPERNKEGALLKKEQRESKNVSSRKLIDELAALMEGLETGS